jgi:hypothetical protein
MRKTTLPALTLGAVLALLPGCSTNTKGDDAAPVFLTGEFNLLPLEKLLVDATPMQFKTTTLHNTLKTTGVASLTFLDVQIDGYQVRWSRVDGGKTASATQYFPGDGIVPANGQTTLTDYPYMSADALLRPPLDQLYPFNGGIDRETGRTEIRQAGHVTWFGHTYSGQSIQSSEATFGMIFIYGGVAGRVEGKPVR